MALTIFLCGHGSWKPNDGTFMLPKGCSMTFIVHHAKLLPTGDMFRVCEGTYPNEPDRTIGEFKSCPNMTWTSDEPWKCSECDKRLKLNAGVGPARVIFPNHIQKFLDGGGNITLQKLFTDMAKPFRILVQTHGELKFIWNCCSHVDLKATKKGGDIGFNAGQGDTEYVFLDLTNGIVPTGTTAAL